MRLKPIVKFLLRLALQKSSRVNELVFRLHRFALNVNFEVASQHKYLEILSLMKPARHSLPLRRFGGENDGGYVLLDAIDPDSVCISLGIADDISFDADLAQSIAQVAMFDYSITQPPFKIANSSFQALKVVSQVEDDTKEIDIPSIFNQVGTNSPIILKVDIEGSEWDCFKDIGDNYLSRCHQIIFEFHGLQKLQLHSAYSSYINFLVRLRNTHTVVNSHINNWDRFDVIQGVAVPNVLEVTYVRNDLVLKYNGRGSDAGEVNFPNNPSSAEFLLYPLDGIPADSQHFPK